MQSPSAGASLPAGDSAGAVSPGSLIRCHRKRRDCKKPQTCARRHSSSHSGASGHFGEYGIGVLVELGEMVDGNSQGTRRKGELHCHDTFQASHSTTYTISGEMQVSPSAKAPSHTLESLKGLAETTSRELLQLAVQCYRIYYYLARQLPGKRLFNVR